ncbi:MAG: PD-(D/E)XK nuclease family protein [Coxiellaceae bacterium]|jgi:probable DNA repair protein|nr:PD-(D/E)XK nuclease family protein [Coxiellaceae bacterium]
MQEKSATLTPNKRLARHLQKQFCTELAKCNQVVWPSKKVLPLTTWFVNLWQESQDPHILLTDLQEKLLWQKIIAENLEEKLIYLADLAINFHELINGWQIKEEGETFQHVYKKFKIYCQDNNFITKSELPNVLIPYLPNYKFKAITFAGFDEYNPQLQTFIEYLEKTDCKILQFDPNNQIAIQKRLSCNNIKEEIIYCAAWAKKIIKNNPKAAIGIIVPNLITLRPKISQIFNEILENSVNINISAGIPLSTLPIINSALEFLSITEQPFHLKKLGKLLLSPYVSGAELERSERILFAAQLNLQDYSQLTSTYNNLTIIKTFDKWQNFITSVQTKNRYGSEWAQTFAQTLKILGWPGEDNLTNLEAIASQHFIKNLQELSTTNPIMGQITYNKALKILHDMLDANIIPLEPERDAPVNIMGILEAIGINFDYLWVMGLDQEHWPEPPKPNQFIPIDIQKKLSLPHSSAERELYFSTTLIKRYKRSAKEVIFSHAKQIDDHIIEPSYLIADIPEITSKDLGLDKPMLLPQQIYNSQKLEILENDISPKLIPNELPHAHSRLIELQSLCPFQAFMEFRLLIQQPQQESFGISKINRGIFIHSILEKFWRKIKTQQNLSALNPDELQKIIQNNIEDTLNKISLSEALYKLEKQCLTALVVHWLEIEKNRQPFQVIATEKSIQINLSSIPIKLRIDRIDQIDNDKTLLIDYKTGKNLPSIFDWFGEHPQNPQLLLYSLALNSIEGLALVHISSESMKFKEINLRDLNSDLKTWSELKKYWEDMLTKIAADFASGHAAPNPISSQVCKQCGFSSACRIKLN